LSLILIASCFSRNVIHRTSLFILIFLFESSLCSVAFFCCSVHYFYIFQIRYILHNLQYLVSFFIFFVLSNFCFDDIISLLTFIFLSLPFSYLFAPRTNVSSLVNLIQDILIFIILVKQLCRFSSYRYHTSPRDPSITSSIVPGATSLNDLPRKREKINRTEGLSHQRITYAAVFFYENAAY